MFAALREVFGWPDLFLGLAVVLAGLAGAVLLRTSSLSVLKLAKSECPNPQGSY